MTWARATAVDREEEGDLMTNQCPGQENRSVTAGNREPCESSRGLYRRVFLLSREVSRLKEAKRSWAGQLLWPRRRQVRSSMKFCHSKCCYCHPCCIWLVRSAANTIPASNGHPNTFWPVSEAKELQLCCSNSLESRQVITGLWVILQSSCPQWGPYGMSVDILIFTISTGRGWQTGLLLASTVETRDAPKYHTMHRTATTNKSYQANTSTVPKLKSLV